MYNQIYFLKQVSEKSVEAFAQSIMCALAATATAPLNQASPPHKQTK